LWSDPHARLIAALAASAGLHAALGGAVAMLPWSPRNASAGATLQVQIRQQAQAPRMAAASAPKRAEPAARPAAPPTAEPPPAPYLLARELDVKPVPRNVVDPPYPNDAYLRNVTGRVLAKLFVSETGEVDKVLIVQAEPAGFFEEAVQTAFKKARFTPALKAGVPVKAQLVVEVRYDSPQLQLREP
jgi:periplasmic protein TonB